MGRPRVIPDPKQCSKCGQPHAKCTGHRRDGAPCGSPRMHGQTICRMHGGKAKQNLNAAARRLEDEVARAAVVTLGLPVDISPSDALLDEVRRTAGHVFWLLAKVQSEDGGAFVPMKSEDSHPGNGLQSVWYRTYQAERAHYVNVCAQALKAGVEERRVKLAEAQGEQVAGVIRAILADLGLTAEQQAAAPEVASRHLRLLAGGAA